MNLFQSKLERNRFFRFMIVGTIGALVDFIVMNILTHQLNMELVFAGSVSFVCAVISNFLWNRYWTYPDSRSRPLAKQLTMFFLVNLAGAGIRIPILYYFEPVVLKIFNTNIVPIPVSNEFLAKNLTLALAITIVMLWNFFINRYWTYNDIKP
jgi:putative flippase GtrA